MVRVVTLLCLWCAVAVAAPVKVPATPAGQAVQAWLDAFDSGDRKKLDAFVATYKPPSTADEIAEFREQTGGFDLIEVGKSEPTVLVFRVREKASGREAIGKVVVTVKPVQFVRFSLRAMPPGTSFTDIDIVVDDAIRTRVIDNIAKELTRSYVFPDIAAKMIAALRQADYKAITDGEDFADRLTKDLQAVSHDLHLRVDAVPEVLPKDDPKPDPKREAQMRTNQLRDNCGFRKAEVLANNIGYIKFDYFADPATCGATVTSAIGFVANTDAVIFDLRDNGGGRPEMVQYVCSYLFAKRTHLNDLFDRAANKTTEFWTKTVPGKHVDTAPIYVLVSKRTFSGGEEFTYNLKNLKRATIVGETTGGGAHPTAGHRVDDHFMIGVPFARAINPLTKTNWEGTGVEPDVKVPAGQALETALKLAAAKH